MLKRVRRALVFALVGSLSALVGAAPAAAQKQEVVI
jgi:hypothetical protein